MFPQDIHPDSKAATPQNAVIIGYFTLDERGAISEANYSGALLLRAPGISLIGQPFQQYVAPEHRAAFLAFYQRAATCGQQMQCQVRLLRRDESSFHAQIAAVAGHHGDFRPVRCFVTVIDISDLRRDRRPSPPPFSG